MSIEEASLKAEVNTVIKEMLSKIEKEKSGATALFFANYSKEELAKAIKKINNIVAKHLNL